ncbi:hypothetical protein AB1M95_10565 [Sulfitobacter sp. LCG007]
MKIILHAGAHFTEEDRLMKCLLRNKPDFARRGVSVPGPGRYRQLLRDSLSALRDSPASQESPDILLDAILDDEKARRLVLSNANLFAAPRGALRGGMIYASAPERLRQVAALFSGIEIRLFMALRNPASFVPACFSQSRLDDVAAFLDCADPRSLRWSDTLIAIREALPDLPMTIWCSEDAPLLWGQIIREMAGLGEHDEITGGFDLLASIMTPQGMARFKSYLEEHDDLPEASRRRVMRAFLDRFAIEEALEEEIDMPHWTQDLVAEMTDTYDRDMLRIESIPNLRLLLP